MAIQNPLSFGRVGSNPTFGTMTKSFKVFA